MRIPLTAPTIEGKYSLESTDSRESEIRAPPQLNIALKLSYYLFIIAKLFKVKDSCLKFVYFGKKSPVYGGAIEKHLLIYDVHMCHTHPFNGPLSGTTRVSRYQKGKNQSGFY